jgi:hypothetical protein
MKNKNIKDLNSDDYDFITFVFCLTYAIFTGILFAYDMYLSYM